MELITLGSKYAQNIIPDGILKDFSIYYGFGVGEDITFDIELVKKYKCNAFLFDPTPRSKNHFLDKEVLYLNTGKNVFEKMKYYDFGIWERDTTIKFYEPKDKNHVSHSIHNLQKTDSYFTAKVYCLKTIMKLLCHTQIDLLKLDIEGAEYAVLIDILRSNLNIKIICAEFHCNIGENLQEKIDKTIEIMSNFGWQLLIQKDCNCTFLKE